MANKKRIKWRREETEEKKLSQALASGLEFAFVSKKREQCCRFFLCKDFLQDAVYNQLYQARTEIFNFQYDPEKDPPIDLAKVRLLLANAKDVRLREKIPACLEFIHQIEDKLKITKTKARECADPPTIYRRGGVWYFEGSARWLNSPVMISLYSLLLRVGFCHELGTSYEITIAKVKSKRKKGEKSNEYQKGDSSKLISSTAGLNKILRNGDRKIFCRDIKENYPRNVAINTLHNNLGIVSFSIGFTKIYVPYWHRQDIK